MAFLQPKTYYRIFFVRKTDQKKKKEKIFFVRNNYRERKNKVKLQFQKTLVFKQLHYSKNRTNRILSFKFVVIYNL